MREDHRQRTRMTYAARVDRRIPLWTSLIVDDCQLSPRLMHSHTRHADSDCRVVRLRTSIHRKRKSSQALRCLDIVVKTEVKRACDRNPLSSRYTAAMLFLGRRSHTHRSNTVYDTFTVTLPSLLSIVQNTTTPVTSRRPDCLHQQMSWE